MLARVTNPLPLVPFAISALLAGVGVTGIVMARRTLTRAQPEPFRVFGATVVTTTPFETFLAMGSMNTLSDAETIRTKPYGYPSFFRPSDEQVVIGLLKKWRDEHGTGSCDLVFKSVPVGTHVEQVAAYVGASAFATQHVLDKLWPKGKPWRADEFWQTGPDVLAAERKGIAQWRAWLWWRVYSLANRHVCGMVPVT